MLYLLKIWKKVRYNSIQWLYNVFPLAFKLIYIFGLCKGKKKKSTYTSREQTFDPRPKWALVPEFFAPGTRNTFSPGWSHQPGLKVYFYSRLVDPTGSKILLRGRGCARGWKVTFSPGWIHQPGLKVPLYIPAVSFFLPEPELSTFWSSLH